MTREQYVAMVEKAITSMMHGPFPVQLDQETCKVIITMLQEGGFVQKPN